MANRMKEKGMREERAVLELMREQGFDAERTRAGRKEDQGDILAPNVSVQVKDVKTPDWSKWVQDLADQKGHAKAEVAFLSVKRSRPGKSPLRLGVMELGDLLELVRRAGYGQ